MATSLYKAPFALRLCEIHVRKELHAYCKTCKIKICSSCTKEDHSTHNWETNTAIIREIRRSLPEVHSKQLPGLKKELDRFDRKNEEEDTRFIRNKAVLNGSRQSYIDKINRLFDDRIDECQQKYESAIQFYIEKREGLKQKVENLDMMTTSLDKGINTSFPDHDILDMEREMREELEKALSITADKYMCTTVFVPGHMNVYTLENMIGEIHSTTVEETNDINRFSDFIDSVQPITQTNAWVKVRNDKYGKLINRDGEVLKSMTSPCGLLTQSKSGDLVLANGSTDYLVLTKDEERIKRIITKPLIPIVINETNNDDILVSMWNGGDVYNLVPTSRRVVQRMNLKGKVLRTYEFKLDGKTRLFTFPYMTAENKNNDICIINEQSKDSGELVVLSKYGFVRFIYKGMGLESGKFDPRDVECDSKCRILLSEFYSRSIHMLNSEGMHIYTLCQYEQLHPYTIFIHGDDLWCGFEEGRVKVFKYSNQ